MKLIYILLFITPLSVFASLDCDPLDPRQQVGSKAIMSIDGSAQTLFKAIKGNVDYKSLTERTIKNLYKDYPNADKIVLNGKMIYVFCTYLNSASDLNSDQKFSKLTEFMQLFIVDKGMTFNARKKTGKQPSFEKNDIVTELQQCFLKGKKLKCFVGITSLEDKFKFTVYAYLSGDNNRHSRVVLPSGKVIVANKVIFSGHEDKRYVTGELISSITFEVILFFDGVIIEGNKLPLLEVQYGDFSARLRSINVITQG